jgi:thioredoxin-related protein
MKTKYAVYVLVVVFCFFTLSPAGVAAAEGINWHTYDNGIALGKKEGKRVFLHFYANWCFYCRKMAKETFQDPSVIAHLNKNFIPIRVDSDKDKRTASMYNVRALPSTWFLTKKGERMGNVPGYVSSKQLLELLKRLATGNNRAAGQGG